MSNTSITKHKRDEFLKSAENRKTLFCKKVSGLYLVKLSDNKGSWRLRYTAADKNRKTFTIGEHSILPTVAAETALQLKSEIRNGIYPDVTKATNKTKALADQVENEKTVGFYFNKVYTPFKIGYSQAGSETLNIIKNHFGHLFERPLLSINNMDVINWYTNKKKKGLTRATLVRNYGAFKAMLNHACVSHNNSDPFISNNPIANVKLPIMTLAQKKEQDDREKKQASTKDLFTDADKLSIKNGLNLYKQEIIAKRQNSIKRGKKHLENTTLLKYPHWFFAFTDIARLTGMRMGDIYSLDWENLQHNKFNGSTTLTFTPSKTKYKTNKVVKFPVTGELLDVLNTYRKEQGNPTSGLLFESKIKGQAIVRGAHAKHWKRVKELGAVRSELVFLSFRHNFISELVQRGVPVLVIAGLVGHADGTMISKNYLRQDEHASAAVLAELSNGWVQAVDIRNAANG